MKKHTSQQGIAPIIILIIAALVIGGGTGTYQAVKKNKEKKARESGELMASTTIEANVNVQATTSMSEAKGSGTLRSLIARNKDVVCTVTSQVSTGSAEGTIYISAGMMRGDFTMKSANSAAIESHMIQSGGTMYMWSGSQGMKMDTVASGNANATAQTQSSIGLDQNYGYECKDWVKDASKFVVPTSVTFTDMSAMMKGYMPVKTNVKVDASGTVNVGL